MLPCKPSSSIPGSTPTAVSSLLARVMQNINVKVSRHPTWCLTATGLRLSNSWAMLKAPKPVDPELRAGEVGFFAATMKTVGDTKIGDTVWGDRR